MYKQRKMRTICCGTWATSCAYSLAVVLVEPLSRHSFAVDIPPVPFFEDPPRFAGPSVAPPDVDFGRGEPRRFCEVSESLETSMISDELTRELNSDFPEAVALSDMPVDFEKI